MAVLQPLFMQNDTTDQTAQVTRLLVKDLCGGTHGIMQESAFKVVQRGAGANNSVDVSAGSIIVPGTESGVQGYYYIVNDAVVNVPMSTSAHATLARVDSIIVYARDSFYTGILNDGLLEYVPGTAAASPVAPDLNALGYKNYYRLANITVPAADNTITTSDISDQRLAAGQGRVTALGGIIVCTNTTKPALPRTGQMIFLTDLKRVEINEGTPTAPVWKVYAVPSTGAWENYTPTMGGLTGAANTLYGRFFRMGTLVAGVCGWTLGAAGNVTGTILASLPATYPVVSSGPAAGASYVGFGRAYDSSTGVWWSCTAEIPVAGTNLINFATAGQQAWNATVPFNWDPGDKMHMLFVYETTV